MTERERASTAVPVLRGPDSAEPALVDLLVAATDTDIDQSVNGFIAVSRAQLASPVAVVLHPAFGSRSWVSDPSGPDLIGLLGTRWSNDPRVHVIVEPSGRLLGWFLVADPDAVHDGPNLAKRFALLITQTLHRLASADSLSNPADRDLLTGLVSRRGLEAFLWSTAPERGEEWSLVACYLGVDKHCRDLDHVDEVCSIVASRLRGVARGSEVVAAIDEDVYAILATADGEAAQILAKRLTESARAPLATSRGTVCLDPIIVVKTASRPDELIQLVAEVMGELESCVESAPVIEISSRIR